MPEVDIKIPYKWQPRDYQKPLWDALNSGFQRAIYVWHRRAGKDLFGLNWLISEAIFGTPGTYWHIFPSFKQGKRAIWQESDLNGRKYLDYFPKELIVGKPNDQEMKIKLWNGSIYQIVGSDDVDSLRGSGVKGVILSEFAEQRPNVWETIEPMIMASRGWALFNFTPKGRNHAFDLYNMAEKNPKWYCQTLTVDDTKEQVFTKEQIEQTKQQFLDSGKTLDLFNQEYYCSFNNAIEGAYYSEQLAKAREEGRIAKVPHDSRLEVDTWWDLGVNDSTAIWFSQQVGNEIRWIDFYQDNGKGLADYIKLVKEKPYIYNTHNAPHDIEVREFTSGKSRLEIAQSLGLTFERVPNIPVQDGIDAVRMIFSRCVFDEEKCKDGLNSLSHYRKEFDEKRVVFKDKPYHDWASDAADAFRYGAVGIREKTFLRDETRPSHAITNF